MPPAEGSLPVPVWQGSHPAYRVLFPSPLACGCKRFAKPTTWRCRVCKRTLPFDNDHFTTDRHNIHGLKWDCKDCDRKSCREYGRRLRHEVLMHYGNGHPACACCGEDNVVFLCLDHINNDGKQDRQKWGPGVGFYLMLKRQGFPGHLQILCYNCNMGRALLGRCPHHPSW